MDSTNMEDSGIPDAAMMDPTMEDLFGEAADSLNVPTLPPAPLPAVLVLRIAETQSRGCCTKLAWSNTGSIAHISPDGSKVSFRSMVRDKKTAVWTISDASKHPIEAPTGRKFVHIQFSGVGIDLAVVDNLGTVHMFTLASPLGRMTPSPGHFARDDTPKNELDAVVAMHWLALFPAEFRSPYIEPAMKNGDKWDFHMRQRDQHNLRVHHPAESRNAVLHIMRSGELTLLYQNEGQGWQSSTVSLGPVRSSDELISHADLGEDGADLLAITFDCSSRFRLFRISIAWNATQHSRGPSMMSTLVSPILQVHHLSVTEHARAQHADTAKLTHLRIIPAASEVAQASPTHPMVLAIFTHASLPTDTTQMQGSFSVLARWSIESFVPTLHESFTRMKSGGLSDVVLNTITVLRRQPDVLTNKVILSLESQVFDTILALGASDGSLEFRDRSTLDPLQSYGETSLVSSLPQAGFEHMPGDHNIHVAMSSDGSGLALVRADGKVVAHPMSFNHGWQIVEDGLGDNRAFVEAAAACIARQFAFLCYNNFSSDESLALVPHDASPEVRSLVVKMVFRVMNRSPDIVMQEVNRQQMIVLRDPLVPRSLSAQLALGTNPVTGKRNAGAQYAFALLNLRLIGTALAHTLIRPDVKPISVEAISSMCGLVKWCTDLSIFVVDTLVNLKRKLQAGSSVRQAFQDLFEDTGNPALHLLLCSFTRALFRFTIAWIGKYFGAVQQSILPRARTLAERKDLAGVLEMAKNVPFKHQEFERMIVDLDQAVRDAWTKSGVPSERRGELERLMMCDGLIPSELEPAINTLNETVLPKLIENVDMSNLFFWSTEWLGLTNSKPPDGSPPIDVIRKVPIAKGAPLRLCRRCGSVMEDISPERTRELPGWLASSQRHCVCNNFWILVN